MSIGEISATQNGVFSIESVFAIAMKIWLYVQLGEGHMTIIMATTISIETGYRFIMVKFRSLAIILIGKLFNFCWHIASIGISVLAKEIILKSCGKYGLLQNNKVIYRIMVIIWVSYGMISCLRYSPADSTKFVLGYYHFPTQSVHNWCCHIIALIKIKCIY